MLALDFSNQKKIKSVIKKIKVFIKQVSAVSSQLIRDVTSVARTDGKVIITDLNLDFKTKRSELNTGMDEILLEAEAFLPEETWYATVDDSTFSLADLIAASSTVEIIVTRLGDTPESAECAFTTVTEPLVHCHHTSLDDMYYDMLCSSVDSVIYRGTTMECLEAYRPSALWCGPLSDEDEEICSNAMDTVYDMLTDSIENAYTYSEDEWDRYMAILELADE